MISVNFGTLTFDELTEIAVRITDKLINEGYLNDCTSIPNQIEYEVQDIILAELVRKKGK